MWPPGERVSDEELGMNPYESFMKKHLQHYGYYTGRNQNYRNGFQQYKDWEKNFVFGEGCSSSSDSDSESDDEKNNRLQEELMRTTQLIYSCESGKMVPKLREPRNLYALAKELGPQQAPRWPSEIEVERGRVSHIYHVPSQPEAFYRISGTEKTPMCRGEENGGKVVFEYDPKFSFFLRSRVGGSRTGCRKCCVDLQSPDDTTLLFESRFESGNLAKAVKINDFEYELWLRYDLYTSKHTQWFYFRVTNMKPNVAYRFTIVNFLKPDSLYNFGMRPCFYSDHEAKENKVGWVRAGHNIKYYRNNLKYETSRGERSFYSLTWTMSFPHENDTAYLAHCYPYTYSDLQDYLLEVQNDPIKSRICKQRVLCRSLAGNLVYVLTITSASINPEDTKHKKAVVLTSRVHPGESNSSWMMKGFLDYLTGNSADAKLLRDSFIFKVVPMLNPDGVIVGNYRCSLTGRDLNRNYKTVLKDSYPSVWNTKNMIRKLLQERDVIMYCDLHGHSRRQNVFIYGCEQRLDSNKRLHERVFPCMLSKNAPDKFSFDSCKFKVQKSKEGTGRIVMWNMGIINSFTMEATFCGSSLGRKKGLHFSVADYEALGYHFCDTLLDYCDPDNSKYSNILATLENRMKLEILARFGRDTTNPDDIHLSDYASDMESSDGGSDSSVSDGPPAHLQFTMEKSMKKKKKLKTRKDRDRVRQVRSEEPKKPSAATQTEEKVSKGGGDGAAASKPDKVAGQPQPLRYSSNSGKRPRSNDERSNNGIPIFVQERFEEKQQRKDYLDALTSAYLRNGIPVNKDQGVFVRMDRRRGSNSAIRIWKLLSRRQADLMGQTPVSDTPASTGAASVDGFIRAQITPSKSIAPLDRRPPSYPHLLEVSAAQQRQQDVMREQPHGLRKASSGDLRRTHSGKGMVRTRLPSATSVNFKATSSPGVIAPVSLFTPPTTQGDNPNSLRDRNHDGRKSRKGMREGEEEMDMGGGPRGLMDVGEGVSYPRAPRVKSAHASQEIVEAMDSIRQLQQSLNQQPKSRHTKTNGTYIKQLFEDTTDKIEDLTSVIDHKIEHKLQEVRELQQHQGTSPRQSPAPHLTPSASPLKRSPGPLLHADSPATPSPALSHNAGGVTEAQPLPDKPSLLPGHWLQSLSTVESAACVADQRREKLSRVEEVKRVASAGGSGDRRDEDVKGASGDGSGEMVPRVRSARSTRHVVEAVPTKISLMICSDHREVTDGPGKQQFLPLYRSVRAPFFRHYSHYRRK